MPVIRSLLIAVLCAAPVGHSALAVPHVSLTDTGASQADEPMAPEGMRTYMAEGTAPTAPTDTPEAQAKSASDALEQCMTTWDAGTHISKSKWREICKRQLKDRDDAYR